MSEVGQQDAPGRVGLVKNRPAGQRATAGFLLKLGHFVVNRTQGAQNFQRRRGRFGNSVQIRPGPVIGLPTLKINPAIGQRGLGQTILQFLGFCSQISLRAICRWMRRTILQDAPNATATPKPFHSVGIAPKVSGGDLSLSDRLKFDVENGFEQWTKRQVLVIGHCGWNKPCEGKLLAFGRLLAGVSIPGAFSPDIFLGIKQGRECRQTNEREKQYSQKTPGETADNSGKAWG